MTLLVHIVTAKQTCSAYLLCTYSPDQSKVKRRAVESLKSDFDGVESFSFLKFWMLKSCRNFERSERSKLWKLGAFKTVELLSSLSNICRRFWSVRRFDSSEISTMLNGLRFRRRTLWYFDSVKRSEISTSYYISRDSWFAYIYLATPIVFHCFQGYPYYLAPYKSLWFHDFDPDTHGATDSILLNDNSPPY